MEDERDMRVGIPHDRNRAQARCGVIFCCLDLFLCKLPKNLQNFTKNIPSFQLLGPEGPKPVPWSPLYCSPGISVVRMALDLVGLRVWAVCNFKKVFRCVIHHKRESKNKFLDFGEGGSATLCIRACRQCVP